MMFLLHMPIISVSFLMTSASICTDTPIIRDLELNTKVTSLYFFKTTTTGPVTCAQQCLLRRRCKSFSFQAGDCRLHHYNRSFPGFVSEPDPTSVYADINRWPQSLIGACAFHQCPISSICRPLSTSNFTCEITGCWDPPYISHATLVASETETPVGDILNYTCDLGYEQYGFVKCEPYGSWTQMFCRPKPSSCAEVRECNSSSADGEYWIYLREFDDERVRVYCHGMNTSTPGEYITLVKRNWGRYPLKRSSKCISEVRDDLARMQRYNGTRTFTKIKVDIKTLEVIVNDTTFAYGTSTILDYGTAGDCYTAHPDVKKMSVCGIKGRFYIDLTNTSFELDMAHMWKPYGFKPYASAIWKNSRAVTLRCGGSCGGCRNDGPLLLNVYPVDDPMDFCPRSTTLRPFTQRCYLSEVYSTDPESGRCGVM